MYAFMLCVYSDAADLIYAVMDSMMLKEKEKTEKSAPLAAAEQVAGSAAGFDG